MWKHPITIALAVAGIVAGAHVAIAAINTEGTENIAEPVAAQTEVQTPAETAEAAPPPEALALAPESGATRATSGTQADEKIVRLPFTNIHLKVTNPTFPLGAVEHPEPLPALVAYFDRRNANIVLTGAVSPVFPSAAVEHPEPLPATVAYFDRIEAQRIAATRPAVPTAMAQGTPPAVATDSPVTTMSSAAEAHSNAIKSEIQASQRPGT